LRANRPTSVAENPNKLPMIAPHAPATTPGGSRSAVAQSAVKLAADGRSHGHQAPASSPISSGATNSRAIGGLPSHSIRVAHQSVQTSSK